MLGLRLLLLTPVTTYTHWKRFVWRMFGEKSNENISPAILNRLIKDVKEYNKNPISDIVLHVNESSFPDIHADVHGPASTPYHGGLFRMKLVFGEK